MQWITVDSNVLYSTQTTKYNKIALNVEKLLLRDNETTFTCNIINLLPTKVTKMSNIKFHIIISQMSELMYNSIIEFYVIS